MSFVINPCPAAAGGNTTMICRPNADVAGLRMVIRPYKTFVVHTFPFASIAQIARFDALRTAGSYLLYSSRLAKAYVGESHNVSNRLQDHINDAKKNYATEVFVVTSTAESYQKPQAVFSQKFFYDAAEAAGLVTLTNEARPHSAKLPQLETAPLVRELSDVFLQLFDGGCRAFHDCLPLAPLIATRGTASAGSDIFTADEDDDCGEMAIGNGLTTVPLGVEESELVYQGLWVRGYWYKDRFVVAAGSEVRVETNAVIPGIVKKRNSLEAHGVLAPIPGVTDRKRLLVPIVLRTDANAAKVCSGAHIDASAWRELARNLPLVIDL